MTPKEHIILCGGVKPAGDGSRTASTLALDLWGHGGGNNVTLRIEDIHTRLWRDVPQLFQDLLEIATYVYCADQATTRGGIDVDTFGGSWRRVMRFHVPVRCPDFWRSGQAQSLLRGTLEFLSDDTYEFNFHPAANAPAFQQYLGLTEAEPPQGAPEQVIMYSGGLDSLTGAVQEAVVEKRRIVLVNHRPTSKLNTRLGELQTQLAEKAGPLRPIHLNVRINKASEMNREYTQRTRSFLYVSLGATVAKMLGLPSVRFYENGVVSLNLPVCAQVVGGRATRTTHPRTLKGFQDLLTLIAGEPFTVENPFAWETKGDIVQRLVKAGCGPLIGASTSCAHTWESTIEHPHCGTCSQCIDRRMAIVAAQAETFDPPARYRADVFTESMPEDEDKIMVATYLERANRIRTMTDSVQLIEDFPEVARVLRYLGPNAANAAERVLALHQRHAAEVANAVKIMIARHAGKILDRTLPGDCLLRIVYESSSVLSLPATPAPGREPAPTERPRYWFRKAGSHWDVRCDGCQVFHIEDTLGAKYLDYLLHHPSEAISAYDLEIAIQPEKAEARPKNSIQNDLDPEATRQYLRELNKLRSEREKAKDDANEAEVLRLDDEIESIEAALTKKGQATDSGERARGNVSKAIAAVRQKLLKGDQSEKTFGEHIQQLVSTGYECIYNQPQGRIWE